MSVKLESNFLSVQNYYNVFTEYIPELFSGKIKKNMHRMIYENSKDKLKAANYIDFLLTLKAENAGARKVLDIGSGLGETLAFISLNTRQRKEEIYVEETFHYYGIVSSVLELRLANSLFIAGYSVKNCRVFLGDYHDVNTFKFFTHMDLVYAIESFSYSYDLNTLMTNVSNSLKIGGEFVICDVFFKKGLDDKDYTFPMNLFYATVLNEESFIKLASKFNLKLKEKKDFTPFQKLEKKFEIFPSIPKELKKGYNKTYKCQKQISKLLKRGDANYLFLSFVKE